MCAAVLRWCRFVPVLCEPVVDSMCDVVCHDCRKVECVEYLLTEGGDINLQDAEGRYVQI